VVYAQRVGKAAAIKEFADRNGSFTLGAQYIWALDFEGNNLAHPWHPEFAGVNQLNLTDEAGFLMIAAMRDAARNGSGFVSYQYENPVTGKIESKLVYVKRVDESWWLASGIYGFDQSILANSPEMVRQALETKVSEAVAFAKKTGRDNALAAFNDPSGPYATNDSYIFAFDMNGTALAMPFEKSSIGKTEWDLTDLNGVRVVEREVAIARMGGGYYYYVYTNPATGKPEFKVTYAQPVDSQWSVAAGTYLPDVPVVFPQDRRDQLVSQVNSAVEYVKKNGRDAAIRTFNDPNGTFSQPDLYIFAFDRNGTLLSSPHLPGVIGMSRLSDRDPYGQYPVPYIIENAKEGGGFMYYFYADPSADYKVRLKLTYSQMAGDDLVVGSGIYS
jgi:polar amino acid transport system substrate-binding protein